MMFGTDAFNVSFRIRYGKDLVFEQCPNGILFETQEKIFAGIGSRIVVGQNCDQHGVGGRQCGCHKHDNQEECCCCECFCHCIDYDDDVDDDVLD